MDGSQTDSFEDTLHSSAQNAQIETYLDRLCVWLALLPSQEREEAREEVRQHIALIAAGERERGATPAEAVAAALDKMGDADALGKRLFDARLKQVQKQIEQVTPQHFKDAMRRYHRAMSVDGAVVFMVLFVVFLWPVYHTDRLTWVTFAIMGAVTGAVIGISDSASKVWLARLLRTLPQRKPMADNVLTLPPLPESASPRGRQDYRQKEHFLREFGQRGNRTAGLSHRPLLSTQISSIAIVVCGTQLTNFVVHHHFALSGLRLAVDMAALFATQAITTLIISWSVKRRLA